MKTPRRRSARVLNRIEAAEMIRAARKAPRGSDERGELIGWAKTVLCENHLVRRLKIDHLLDTGEYDSADALIARSLMRGNSREAGVLMRCRFARSLHAQGRLEQAWHQITHVLAERPQHGGALQLGAQIAGERDDFDVSVELLIRACSLQPKRIELRAELVEALVANGQVHGAAVELGRIDAPPPTLVSRVLRAQGRTLEAVELLERAAADNRRSESVAELNLELIAALEELGDASRLNGTLESAGQDLSDSTGGSETLLRAAKAMLSQGQFENVLAAVEPMRNIARHRRAALPLVIAALTMLDRTAEARHALVQWREVESAPNTPLLADIWLSALYGRTLVESVDFRSAGRDPALNLLRPMLTEAAAILHQASQKSTAANSLKPAVCSQFRDICLRALGQAPVESSATTRTASIQRDAKSPAKTSWRRAA